MKGYSDMHVLRSHEALMKYELGGFRQIDKILDSDAKKKMLFICANAQLL